MKQARTSAKRVYQKVIKELSAPLARGLSVVQAMPGTSAPTSTNKPRKTLQQLQSEVTVKDPSAHAKKQVSELDKTAKRSLAKRKACNEQLASDKAEISYLEHQIAQIHRKYDPLCQNLKEAKERKAALIKTLEQCSQEEKRMMGSMSATVVARKQDDSKLCRKMATQKLELERGFTLGVESTFHQKH